MIEEVWKQIPGAMLGWEASSEGRIRSHRHEIRPQWDHNKGYLLTTVPREGGGRWQSTVHAFVALAFHGPRPEGMQVAHGDHDKHNNRPDNLRYATRLDNVRDGDCTGRMYRLADLEVGQSVAMRPKGLNALYEAGLRARSATETLGRGFVAARRDGEVRITRTPMLEAMTCSATAEIGGAA